MALLKRLLLLSAVYSCIAAPTGLNHVLHEKRTVSNHWQKGERVHGDVKLPMRIGLTQSNLDRAHEMLDAVSSPESASYGKHYSAESVADIFAPSANAVATVKAWLHTAGVEADRVSQSVNKQWLQFDAKTSEAEELLKAQYHFYEHGQTGKSSIACDEYHVPAHVQSHVDYITPGIKLYATRAKKADSAELEKRGWRGPPHRPHPPKRPMPPGMPSPPSMGLQHCDTVATPDCIAALYNITKGTKASKGNQLGIFEDLGDYYSQTDLNLFFANFTPYIPQGTHPKLDAIDGAIVPALTNVADAGAESDLDFQISYPIIWPQTSVLYQTDDPVYEANYTYEGFLNNFLDAIDGSYCSYFAFGETGNSPLDPQYPDPAPGGYKGSLQCGVYRPTNVISISYGGQESDLPVSYQKRQCNEFMKLGLQGISVCVSSGDSGVAGPLGDGNADGCLGTGQIFSPDFPATCPYITTLGATVLPLGADVRKDQEVAVTRFPSGGGFSNIYPIPSYQASAVAGYFKNHNPSYPYYETTDNKTIGANGGIYNRIGRGYPDFSAIGDNVAIYNQGALIRIGGTSASSPAFASILTRVNEERIAVGKKTIGFVNPVLYAHPEVLHDITVGNNSGCGTPGFYAATGWDP
ncbi:Tripeptidyl-peptidase sed1 [Elasticomyces elasticus]|nr:Tripeptidyl-peptidase sed1 [Elasticomyces elasticus]KAK3667857.1 Tripeptidyl-peptidase sed1 [Elasticomyces elasticus]KAK5763470.1 Tripeptidyl-peptidase sed1 [Elasticomyces elasticus]